jgi:hypothetical protein
MGGKEKKQKTKGEIEESAIGCPNSTRAPLALIDNDDDDDDDDKKIKK